MPKWEGYDLIDEDNEEYTITDRPPWGMMFANQVERINRSIMYGRTNAQAFRDNVDILYSMLHGDVDERWKQDVKELEEWYENKLHGLPPKKREIKKAGLSFEYTMKKFRLLMDLSHRRGYAGGKRI